MFTTMMVNGAEDEVPTGFGGFLAMKQLIWAAMT
jgi:hypothetical protein